MATWPDLAADCPPAVARTDGAGTGTLGSGWEALAGPAALRSDPPLSRLARLRWRAEVLLAELAAGEPDGTA
jgi:hypothetical protein